MGPQNNGSVVVALQVKKHSFLDNTVGLEKMNRELSKVSKDAIDVLVLMLGSTDDRMKMQAAIKLLEFGVAIKQHISQDQMQRLVAEIKLTGNAGGKTLEIEDSARNRPIVNFSEIRSLD